MMINKKRAVSAFAIALSLTVFGCVTTEPQKTIAQPDTVDSSVAKSFAKMEQASKLKPVEGYVDESVPKPKSKIVDENIEVKDRAISKGTAINGGGKAVKEFKKAKSPIYNPPTTATPAPRVAPWESNSGNGDFGGETVSIYGDTQRFGDAILTVSRKAGYSVIFGPQVNPEKSIFVELKEVPYEKALQIMVDYANYGIEIDRVKKTVTITGQVCETLDLPIAMMEPSQTYINIGGDMLGGQQSSTGGSGGGSGGSASGGSGNSNTNMKASIILSRKSATSSNFKEKMEENIRGYLSPAAGDNITGGLVMFDWGIGTARVCDTPNNVKTVRNYVTALTHKADKSINVESIITAVTLNDSTSYGIDWSTLLSKIGGTKIDVKSASAITSPALTISTTASSLAVVFKATQSFGDSKIIKSTRATVKNLQTTALFSSTSQPFLSGVTKTTGTTLTSGDTYSYTIATVQDGVSLVVTPHLRADGLIDVQILPVLTQVKEWKSFTIGSDNLLYPVTTVNQQYSTVTIKPGETILLGGVVDTTKSDNSTGVPILSRTPILGMLFKNDVKQDSITQLVIAIKVDVYDPHAKSQGEGSQPLIINPKSSNGNDSKIILSK